ncbi:hypothetical protein [Pontiella sp.]|uniref:hypothetical protein n=1 Tax=Pontiella sp. TaxID=2837462 RepID=UPI00356AA3DE
MKQANRWIIFFCTLALAATHAKAEDLKAYYEKQKAEIAPTFTPPKLGSEVSVTLAAGQTRKGILMKLNTEELELITDTGTMVAYKRTALHESSRADFFAEDYAHAMALEKTREYKQELHLSGIAEEQANTHDGRISVTLKSEKSVDKESEEEEKENENSGVTTTTTTTTRSQTEVDHLKITVANNTTHPDSYTLEYYFFGETVSKSNRDRDEEDENEGKISIVDGGTRRVTVDARKRLVEEVSSKPFVVEKITVETERSNSDYTSDPRVTEKGTESAGWLVLLKYGGDILDKKASSNKFLEDEWMNNLRLP